MPRTLALHFELKPRQRRVVNAGPGDTLRLVHALRPYLEGGVDVITTSPIGALKGLFATEGHWRDGRVWHEGPVRWRMVDAPHHHGAPLLARILADARAAHGLRWDDYAPEFVHAYIGLKGVGPVPMTLNGLSVRHRRIDIDACPQGRLRLPPVHPGRRPEVPCFAAAIRLIQAHPARNTPAWFVADVRAAIRRLAIRHGVRWRVLWYGFGAAHRIEQLGVEVDHLPDDEEVAPYADGQAMMLQIKRLARCAAAVGFNSGGLDLAAAAGCPTLRVGEFQDDGPEDEPEATKNRLAWGRGYNSFLARATNVGLKPARENPSSFDRQIFRKTLVSFLLHIGELESTRHLLLPVGRALVANRERFLRQLAHPSYLVSER
jgi:hypothetical protein